MRLLHCFPQCLLAVALAGVALTGAAQSPSARPVRVIVPFPPGGGADVLIRLVSPRISERMGQQIVIENRAGASGLLGANLGADAAPDCQTLTLGTSSNFSIMPGVVKKPPYDPVRDFVPVALVAKAPLLLAVHPSLPARSTKELIALAKSKPKQLLYGSNGAGSLSHLTTVLFEAAARVEMVHVAYKGGTPAATDTIAGHVSVIITAIPTLSAHVKSGRLRALGITALKRSPLLPEVPSIADTALPGFESVQWYGVFGPKGTPAQCVERIHGHFDQALRTRETAEVFARDGSEPGVATPAEFAQFVRQDVSKWVGIIKSRNLQLD